MKYDKQPLTHEEQADRLISRGLDADRDVLVARLRSVSYYRLSGYLHPYRNPDDSFKPGTTLDDVWQRYVFDRQLRLLALDAIERVEIAVRSDVVYHLAHAQGAFGYVDPAQLPRITNSQHADLMAQLTNEYSHSREAFAIHFRAKYGDMHSLPPLWMVSELMTFGMLLTMCRGVPKPIWRQIAQQYGVADDVLMSWLRALNGVRNTCAHHARLWNRVLGYRPMIPDKDQRWHKPVTVRADRVYSVFTILKYMLNRVAPQSGWSGRLVALMEKCPKIPRNSMGFPDEWPSCPIWL